MQEILRTRRLLLREMTEGDLPDLKEVLQDPEVMTAYEHSFSDRDVAEWLARQRERYRRDGFGLWAWCCAPPGRWWARRASPGRTARASPCWRWAIF